MNARGLLWKLVLGGFGIALGILSQLQVDEDIVVVTKTVALTASRAKVFQYLSDLSSYSQWFPGVKSLEAVDSAPMSIGKHFQQVYTMPVIGDLLYNMMISGYESPRYISFLQDDWLESKVEIDVVRHADRTKWPTSLTWTLYSRRRSYLMKYIVVPVVSVIQTNTARQALFNLKFAFQE